MYSLCLLQAATHLAIDNLGSLDGFTVLHAFTHLAMESASTMLGFLRIDFGFFSCCVLDFTGDMTIGSSGNATIILGAGLSLSYLANHTLGIWLTVRYCSSVFLFALGRQLLPPTLLVLSLQGAKLYWILSNASR